MKFTRASVFLAGFYVALLLSWLTSSLFLSGNPLFSMASFTTGIKDVEQGYVFALLYGLLAIVGGVMGFNKAEKWGLFKSSMGKALVFLSFGLIAWGYGELIWSYYNFVLREEVPYPSWADVGFVASYPLWLLGVIYLGKATGANFGLRKMQGKVLVISIPLIVSITSYYLLVIVARNGVLSMEGDLLKVFFDLAYPIMDAIILAVAVLLYGLSFKYLGGIYKLPVLITLLGFVANYIADFGFSYTTTVGTFYNGNWVDLMFATTLFLVAFGILNFDTRET